MTGVLLLSLLAGCGGGSGEYPASQRVEITGYVRIDGNALPSGVISLVPIEGTQGPKATAPIESGVFAIPRKRGPLPGKYRVEIQKKHPREPDPDDEEAALRYQQAVKSGKVELPKVPPEFNIRSKLIEEIPAESHRDLHYDLTTAQR